MYVFTDCRLSAQAAETLLSYGHTVISCPPHPALDPAIASHPDMLLFPFDGGIFVHTEHQLCAKELPLICIRQTPAPKYPCDVLLNAARVGSFLLCRPDAVADELIEYAKKQALESIDLVKYKIEKQYNKINDAIKAKNLQKAKEKEHGSNELN